MKSIPSVSVIIPVFNLEKYISKAIQSIIDQSFNDWEIIAVDDGSKDSSASIIEDFCKKDSRVISVKQPNGGAASARNAGLKFANGKYITFLDGDDALSKDTLKEMVDILENNPTIDWVEFPVIRVNEKGEELCGNSGYVSFKPYNFRIFEAADIPQAICERQLSSLVCGTLYRTSSIRDLKFDSGEFYEDSMFFIRQLGVTTNCAVSPIGGYLYLDRAGSAQKAAFSEKHLRSKFKCLDLWSELYTKDKEFYSILTFHASQLYYLLRNEYAKGNNVAKSVLTLFLRKGYKRFVKPSIKSEIRILIYRLIGYDRLLKIKNG